MTEPVIVVSHVKKLGRTHKGEIGRIKEEHCPFAFDIIVAKVYKLAVFIRREFKINHLFVDYCLWDIKYPKEHRKQGLKVLTTSEQRRIMDFLAQHMSYRNLGIYICLSTGMRIGEICALKWSDINISDRVINVQRTIERIYITDADHRHTEVAEGPPKTVNSIREIPIGMQLIKMLRPIMKIVYHDAYILTNDTKPLEPRLYHNYYNNMIRRHNLPRINFHGLRHSFATRCIESKCDYKTVSIILGHANISTTMNLYVHPGIDQKRKCIDRMMRVLR